MDLQTTMSVRNLGHYMTTNFVICVKSLKIFRTVKSRRLWLDGHVVKMEETRNAQRIVVGKTPV